MSLSLEQGTDSFDYMGDYMGVRSQTGPSYRLARLVQDIGFQSLSSAPGWTPESASELFNPDDIDKVNQTFERMNQGASRGRFAGAIAVRGYYERPIGVAWAVSSQPKLPVMRHYKLPFVRSFAARLGGVYVLPEERGNGIEQRLLDKLPKLFLEPHHLTDLGECDILADSPLVLANFPRGEEEG